MILNVTHRTHYRYALDAVFSQHLLRLAPRDAPGQRVLDTAVEIDPAPDSGSDQTDMFGNRTHVATVSRLHRSLEIVAKSRIDRAPPSEMILEASAPWEDVSDLALGLRSAPPGNVAPFAFPSQMTLPDRAIEAFARECMTPGQPILMGAQALASRIFDEFEYQPGTTQADTLPTDALKAKRGVCQDFAHVMLAALRSRRVPARYVSGYLRTVPPPGTERLQGADASHAWVSVWDPVLGWVDFDPTNNLMPGTDHVTLAWGRDFADVSPVSGIVVGAGQQVLTVGVDVV